MGKKHILVVDDEAHIRRILQVAFEKEKYTVTTAEDASQALMCMETTRFDAVITDVTMPGKSGYELLSDIRSLYEGTPVIVMTAFGTIPQAVQAVRNGAFEYLTKPVDLEVLKRVVNAATSESGAKPGRKGGSSKRGADFIAVSPAMQEVRELVERVADSKATVLITGESGTGKEVVAKALHTLSCRSNQPFVAVSCAALPETLLESELFGYEKGAFTGANGSKLGRFEMAQQGTLFLDEIGEIPLQTQVKLLRVLQEREFERLGGAKPIEVDVRLVTATNRNLQDAVDEGIFRLDLMYRLQVVEIAIAPLRERLEDIRPLATHFVAKYCKQNGIAELPLGAGTLEALEHHSWPGNVRELENVIERAVVLAGPNASAVTLDLLPKPIQAAA